MAPKHPERRTLRLPNCDYSQPGAYFLTIANQNKLPWFGDIVDGVMISNDAGLMAATWWHKLADKFQQIELDAFVLRPNHVHGIIIIGEDWSSPYRRDRVIIKSFLSWPAKGTRPRAPTMGN